VRVVLDANVLVAALATRGACAELYARVLAVHEYAVDSNLEGEVVRVLRDKFKLPAERLAGITALLGSTAIRLTAPPLDEPACRDPDDDRVLMLALAFRADVLVTGDEDLLVLHPWKGIPILRPREFWLMDRKASG
jgi:putative PIN family toxin of toxin-antitoxin system